MGPRTVCPPDKLSEVAALLAPTSAVAQGSDDTDFVEAAYEGLLGRSPDANGLAFWTGRLTRAGSGSGRWASLTG